MRGIKEIKEITGIKRWLGEAVDLLFPRRCPGCDEPVRRREGFICKACKDKFQVIKTPYCFRCGKPLADAEQIYCKDCKRGKHLYLRGRALYKYASVAEAVYRFKYAGRQEYAAYFGRQMAAGLGDFIEEVKPDALVPVPLSSQRLQKRGYNQAELLAKEVGRTLKIPVCTDFVKRVKNTVPQKQLNAIQRQNNLKKAFKIVENDVKLNTIIIVDDIYTTGSTVNALAEVLLKAGIQKIYFISLSVGSGI